MSTDELREHLGVFERAVERAERHPFLPAEAKDALRAAAEIMRVLIDDLEERHAEA